MSELEETQKQLEQAQVILAYVLNTVGPVLVKQEDMAKGLPEGATIAIDNDAPRDGIVVRLADESEFQE